jgi:DNA-binding transcriptional MocR family regulator
MLEPIGTLQGLAAGLHAVARLADHVEEDTVVAGAGARSIGLRGMSAYRFDGRTRPPQLVLGFGHLRESEIEEGIAPSATCCADDAVSWATWGRRRAVKCRRRRGW